ncbi:MAG TPA: transglycosylase domain-containing protein [Daejeonella sp.]|nr:transglycosylase domain-containing protein [Daejeonella sp.]
MFRRIKFKPLRYSVIFLYFIILLFCAIELNFLGLFGYSPDIVDIKTPNMRIASELYTADGKLIGRYYKENRTPVEYEKIAPSVVNALIATEDARFFQHSGVDFRSLISSLVSTAAGDRRGASTITQQLAKNLYSTRNKKSEGLIKYVPGLRTVVYKFKELMTAIKLEGYYTKPQILTLYLNTVPFGGNTYGIKTAAKHFFNKQPSELDVQESATLIGILKANTTYNPVRNPEKSLERRNVVLSQMQKYNYLTANEYQRFSKLPLITKQGEFNEGNEGESYLKSAAANFIKKWCEENNYDLYEGGLKIYTTIDSRLQNHAEEAVISQMKRLQRRLNNEWGNEKPWRNSEGDEIEDYALNAAQRLPVYDYLKKRYNNNADSIRAYLERPKSMNVFSWDGEKKVEFSTLDSLEYYSKFLNTGMMTLDPFSGHIKVWIGGINHQFFKYDHVNQAKRQAGSTFKPFAYLAALESGMTPCDKMTDKPVKIKYVENNETEYWEPNNASYSFSYREMTLRHAMARSINSVTAQITEKVGAESVVEYAHKCGIDSKLKAVPSVGLGANDVSVFEMVKAYGTFLNKGVRSEPILVERITDKNGKVLAEFKAETSRAISEEMAWLMMYMLRGGMEEPGGTSQALWEWELFKKGNQIAGKTGTSSDYVDGWYMGLTKDLVTGVWVGCDERTVHFRSSGSGEGSKTALPIFATFMEKVYQDSKSGITFGPFPKPEVEITMEYNCVTPPYEFAQTDTLTVDSSLVDSLALPIEPVDSVQLSLPEPETEQVKATPEPKDKPAKPATPQPKQEQKKTRKELREERRKKDGG